MDAELNNIERWVAQSYVDASVPRAMLGRLEGRLRGVLDRRTRRLGLAGLYSGLLREWLDSSAAEGGEGMEVLVEADGALEGGFEVVEKDR